MQLIAVGTYPHLEPTMVDLVFQIAPGRFRVHEGICRERPDDEGHEWTELDVIGWAAAMGDNVVMVHSIN